MRQIAWEQSERMHASRVDPFLFQVTEKALSYVFLAGIDAANDGLRILSYHFAMNILMEMAATGRLDKIVDRNIERWAQLSTFKDAFVRRALISSKLFAQ